MTTIHFVYPHGKSVSCPDAIGRKVGAFLEGAGYRVLYYDFGEARTIHPADGDILLGHPHPFPWTIFRRSSRSPGWSRVIAICPYSHGDTYTVSFLDRVVRGVDQYLAITGSYWFDTVSCSPYAHWLPKMVHLDLAVDRADFPRIKRSFHEPGDRRFLYIGNTLWCKNTQYLSRLARRLPRFEFAWIGRGSGIANVRPLGFQDFSTEISRSLVSKYDFLITVGTSDANPTTILEAMSWGLIPVCTPQSGYYRHPGIVNIPLDDEVAASRILEDLQSVPADRLHEWQAINDQALASHYNWERFCGQVLSSITSSASPQLLPQSQVSRGQILAGELMSPLSVLRWNGVKHLARVVAKRTAFPAVKPLDEP
jgi:glycosyltransferase involved in cell wall biosynthesis